MKKQRNESLDIIGGLLIIHMISGHIFGNFTQLDECSFFRIERFLLFFFMPWFFFKGGMFFKHNPDYKAFAQKSFKRLMIPFLFWGIIGTFFFLFYVATSEYNSVLGWYLAPIKFLIDVRSFLGNEPLWFLLSLFIAKVVYNYCFNNKVLTWIWITVSVVVPSGFYYAEFISLPIVSHSLLGFFFFHCGYQLREKQYLAKLFITSIGFYLAIVVFSPTFVGMYRNGLVFGDCYLIYFPYAFVAIIVCNNIFRYFAPSRCNKISQIIHIQQITTILESVGRNSMNYLVTHWILLLIIKTIMVNFLGVNNSWTKFWVMVIACILILPLLSRVLNHPHFDIVMGKNKRS